MIGISTVIIILVLITTTVYPLSFFQVSVFAQTSNQTQAQAHETSETSEEESQTTTRTFFEFNTGIPAFNVTLFPPDQFSDTSIIANQGDNVTVNFFNMEAPAGDRHSFTINAPYKINLDLAPGKNGTASFIANHPGVYQFYCEYHEPTMTGQFVVLPKK
jgi:nitrous oxide reductase